MKRSTRAKLADGLAFGVVFVFVVVPVAIIDALESMIATGRELLIKVARR